jgi:hypothetical protein
MSSHEDRRRESLKKNEAAFEPGRSQQVQADLLTSALTNSSVN